MEFRDVNEFRNLLTVVIPVESGEVDVLTLDVSDVSGQGRPALQYLCLFSSQATVDKFTATGGRFPPGHKIVPMMSFPFEFWMEFSEGCPGVRLAIDPEFDEEKGFQYTALVALPGQQEIN